MQEVHPKTNQTSDKQCYVVDCCCVLHTTVMSSKAQLTNIKTQQANIIGWELCLVETEPSKNNFLLSILD